MFFVFAACTASTPEVLPTWDDAGPDLEPGVRADDPGAGLGDLDPGFEGDTAEVSDGPACPSLGAPTAVGTLPRALDEVSGMVASRTHPGVLWVLEDSGNAAELYALDIDGSLLATVRLPVPNVDWEDLAIAPCGDIDCLWIADVGDNGLVRTDAALYVVAEPEPEDGAAELLSALPVRYVDGPHNVEALVLDADGTPTLLSKRDDGTTEVLVLRDGRFGVTAQVQVAAPGDDAWSSRVTAADLWADEGGLLLRTYAHAWRYELDGDSLAGLADAPRTELRAADQEQVEAVAWDPTIGGWWQTSEGVGATLYFATCEA